MSSADTAWDPSTGETVAASDFAELLAAAGAVPTVAPTPQVVGADALRIDLILTAHDTGQSNVVDTFITSDINMASDRMCSFLSRIVDCSSQVRIQIGALAAMICLHQNRHSYLTAWMHRGLAHRSDTPPATVVYSPAQLPMWTQAVCRAFQSMVSNGAKVEQLQELARRRELMDQHTRANAGGYQSAAVM